MKKKLSFSEMARSREEEMELERYHQQHSAPGFWGAQGAGVLFMARDTGRILFSLRSVSVEQPHTWGTYGGAIDPGETPAVAAKREAEEEAGYDAKASEIIPLFVFQSGSFRFSNFLILTPSEFEPKPYEGEEAYYADPPGNWESESHVWTSFGNWPEPLHFGAAALLKDPASYQTIQKLAAQFSGQPVREERVDELVNINTPAFRQWFGNSKVVDEQGRPQMVFHGTGHMYEFTEIQGMSHFGTLRAATKAMELSTAAQPDAYEWDDDDYDTTGERIFPVYLKIENPIQMDDAGESHNSWVFARDLINTPEVPQQVKEALVNLQKTWLGDDYYTQQELYELRGYDDEHHLYELKKVFMSFGYDGIVYKNTFEHLGSTSWVIFHPEQVRYAYAESITEARIDELVDINNPAFRQWFDGSQVVDEQGKPAMVFHGTRTDREFGKLRAFSHFGSLAAASTFSDDPWEKPSYTDYLAPGRIYPVYLKIKNPAPMREIWSVKTGNDHNSLGYLYDLKAGARSRIRGAARGKQSSGFEPLLEALEELEDQWLREMGVPSKWSLESILSMSDLQAEYSQILRQRPEGEGRRIVQLLRTLISLGFDGIIYANALEDPGSMSWVPFHQSQIRYAYAESQRVDELVDINTPRFKKWFGRSRVTKLDGTPQMVFHGTTTPHEFKTLRPGTHFGTPGQAEYFSKPFGNLNQTAPRIYPVYLRIENPIEMHDAGVSHGDDPEEYFNGLLMHAEMYGNYHLQDQLEKWEDQVDLRGMPNKKILPTLMKFLATLGYDGITYENAIEDKGYRSWIPFNRNQIKYAYAESMMEGVTLSSSGLPPKFFHGTLGTDNAKKIMQQGVQAQRVMNPKTHLSPIQGRVYAAQNLSVAMMYAMGGAVAGHKLPEKSIDPEDPYGYLFVIDKEEFLEDVQPDEDNVGETWMYADMVQRGKVDSLKTYYFKDPLAQAVESDEYFMSSVWYLGRQVAHPKTLRHVQGGEYIWFAKLGKMMLRKMSAELMEKFIAAGSNVSIKGPLEPTEVWRLDRRRTEELKPDGSNFFQVAERIA